MALNLMGDFDRLTAFFRKDLRKLLNVTINMYPWTQSKPAIVQNKSLIVNKIGVGHFSWEITCKMHRLSIFRLGNLDQHRADQEILRWPVVEELWDALGTLVR